MTWCIPRRSQVPVSIGQLEVTTIVDVVTDIYLFYYYYHYDSSHFHLTDGHGSGGLEKRGLQAVPEALA